MSNLVADSSANQRGIFVRRLFVVASAIVLSMTLLLAGAKPGEAGYASIILDADTGEVLRSRNADTRNYPASLTKMMTLYMLFDELDSGRMNLKTKLKVSKRAAGQPASKLGLKRGEKITAHQAIMALATKSANDVATVVAEAISGSEWEFAIAMTKRARDLGMKRTRFRNASGLPNRKQLSSARDMGILATALLRDFPQYYDFFSTTSFTYRGVTHRTHNNLLYRYPGMDGMKTGYIRASGFNLVATATRKGRRVIAVVFGGRTARSRDNHMVKLLDLGFDRMAKRDWEQNSKQVAGVHSRKIPIPIIKPGAQLGSTQLIHSAVLLPTRPRPKIGKWAIQIGAYRSVQAAESALKLVSMRLTTLLLDASAALTPIEMTRGDILYRARFLGLRKSEATKACNTLKSEAMPCAVMPNPDLQLAHNSE